MPSLIFDPQCHWKVLYIGHCTRLREVSGWPPMEKDLSALPPTCVPGSCSSRQVPTDLESSLPTVVWKEMASD